MNGEKPAMTGEVQWSKETRNEGKEIAGIHFPHKDSFYTKAAKDKSMKGVHGGWQVICSFNGSGKYYSLDNKVKF